MKFIQFSHFLIPGSNVEYIMIDDGEPNRIDLQLRTMNGEEITEEYPFTDEATKAKAVIDVNRRFNSLLERLNG